MNILFLADPDSIHDIKWINTIISKKVKSAFILPRKIHRSVTGLPGITILSPIDDFSIVMFYKTILTAFKIRHIVRSNKINIVHILYAEPNALWCIFRKFIGVPVIITSRGTDVLKTIPQAFNRKSLINRLVAPLYKLAFQQADWVTSTSERQIESIKVFSGRTSKISIVRTGVDLKTIENSINRKSVLGSNKYFLFPRLMKPIYNHEFCIEAIHLLSDSLKREYKMVFVGRNSGDILYQNFLEEKMRNIPYVEFVFLDRQNQENLLALYRNSSLVVMTPKSDGSPVSAMEAILCGAKVILGPLEYDSEIFSNVKKIQQWDKEELAKMMTDYLMQPQTVTKLSTTTKQLVDIEYNMAIVRKIYERLLNAD
jgi:hypothetical protein